MKLRFDTTAVEELSRQYEANLTQRERRLSQAISYDVIPSYLAKRHLTKPEFLIVCEWKHPRSLKHCQSNGDEEIRDISALVLGTQSELIRIQAWTLLAGVNWQIASAFLHFAFGDSYPILDYRTLWSLEAGRPRQYTFPLWQEYTTVCQQLAKQAGATMRSLDQALVQYYKLNHPR
jgi:hypothetical protein